MTISEMQRLLFLTRSPIEADGPVDRYGYEIAREPARPAKAKLMLQQQESEKKRELKWITMLGSKVDPSTGSQQGSLRVFWKTHICICERRVLKGIPTRAGPAWYEIRDSKDDQPRPSVDDLLARDLPCDHTIQIDILRTIPNIKILFSHPLRQSLYRILQASAMRTQSWDTSRG
jgi:hypothetical protein